jgi:hypothetical protein
MKTFTELLLHPGYDGQHLSLPEVVNDMLNDYYKLQDKPYTPEVYILLRGIAYGSDCELNKCLNIAHAISTHLEEKLRISRRPMTMELALKFLEDLDASYDPAVKAKLNAVRDYLKSIPPLPAG